MLPVKSATGTFSMLAGLQLPPLGGACHSSFQHSIRPPAVCQDPPHALAGLWHLHTRELRPLLMSQKVGTVIPILQMLKRRHRGAKEVSQGHRALGGGPSQDSFSN